jgi:hypothetical protein
MSWRGKAYVGKDERIPNAEPHLRFVLTDAQDDESRVVLVAMTSLKDWHVTASSEGSQHRPCLLTPGDADCECIEEFLTKKSTIAYWDVTTPTVSELCKGIGLALEFVADVPESLVFRMQEGLLALEDHVNPIAVSLISGDRRAWPLSQADRPAPR